MHSKTTFSCVLLFVAVAVLSYPVEAHKKKCIAYCGSQTGIDCPSNYSCVNWDGCGESCLRESGYQPDYCPMRKCVPTDCPLGFHRDEEGCEGCSCGRPDVVQYIVCPMAGCVATDCPLGFLRDDQGCEGCLCGRMDLVTALEDQDYGGSASTMTFHTCLCLTLAFTILRYLGW